MPAGHLEPLAAILRVGGAHGEPWTWSVVVSWDSPTSVRLLGALRGPTYAEARAMREVLIAAGVKTARFERRRPSGMQEHTWRLERV